MAKTALQKFEYREIPRGQIRKAPYNPREINAYQRKNLRASLEKFGMTELLIWNQKTGNLVGGHQRLSIMDEIEGNADYTVAVSAVNLTEKQEKQLNVLLNNRQAQGQFTQVGLLDLVKDGVSLEDMAMTRLDIEEEFGACPALDDILNGLKAAKEEKKGKPDKDPPKLNKNEVRKAAADNPENDASYYVIVEFETAAAKEIWLRRNHFPAETQHLAIGELEAAIGAVV